MENLSPDENEPLVNIKGTKTFTLIENLIDSLILPVYDRPVYYCTQQYRPSSSEFNSITEILIDKLKFLASVAPAQFRSSYLAQIKALETPIAIDQTLPTLTKEEEVKLIELRRLISINGDHWGVAMLDPQMLHLLAKEQGQDIPFKICKYYIDALIKMYSIGTNSRQLSNLNTKVTKMLNGEIPIMRLVQS